MLADKPSERAIVFVDGNNFYHGLKQVGVHNQGSLSFLKIAQKVCGTRQLLGVRYYVGQVTQSGNRELYRNQRSFIDRQQAIDPRIKFFFGRMESRVAENGVAKDLQAYLLKNQNLDRSVRVDLSKILGSGSSTLFVEKAVDVMLAVDLVLLAETDNYDCAYILSADGDYTHAVEHVRSKGKKVYALSASNGAELARKVNSFIPIKADWLNDCYMDD